MNIPAGLQGQTFDNCFFSFISNRIVIGLVSHASYAGSLSKNSFNYNHFGLNHLSLSVDGQTIPSQAFDLDFPKTCVMGYESLFSGTNMFFQNMGNDISRTEYANGGNCLFVFDLTADNSSNCTDHWNILRRGNLRLNIRFKEALKEAVTCIVYGEFNNTLEIDINRRMRVDYTS
jgi:hypothetical protein